jgi:hypothetical protein
MPNPSFKSMILMLFSRAHLISKTPGQPTQTANQLKQAEGWTEIGKNGKKTPGNQTPQKPHYPKR